MSFQGSGVSVPKNVVPLGKKSILWPLSKRIICQEALAALKEREKHEEEVAIDKMKLRVESSFSIPLTERRKVWNRVGLH